jgi:ADP-ribosylation factor related protein 1
MFSLLFGLFEYIFRKEELHVLILGERMVRLIWDCFYSSCCVIAHVETMTCVTLNTCAAGVDKAGKTTLLERLKTMYGDLPGTDPDKILPTVGLNVGRMQVLAQTPQAPPLQSCSPRTRSVLGAESQPHWSIAFVWR